MKNAVASLLILTLALSACSKPKFATDFELVPVTSTNTANAHAKIVVHGDRAELLGYYGLDRSPDLAAQPAPVKLSLDVKSSNGRQAAYLWTIDGEPSNVIQMNSIVDQPKNYQCNTCSDLNLPPDWESKPIQE